jgi:hypothetical protein
LSYLEAYEPELQQQQQQQQQQPREQDNLPSHRRTFIFFSIIGLVTVFFLLGSLAIFGLSQGLGIGDVGVGSTGIDVLGMFSRTLER